MLISNFSFFFYKLQSQACSYLVLLIFFKFSLANSDSEIVYEPKLTNPFVNIIMYFDVCQKYSDAVDGFY